MKIELSLKFFDKNKYRACSSKTCQNLLKNKKTLTCLRTQKGHASRPSLIWFRWIYPRENRDIQCTEKKLKLFKKEFFFKDLWFLFKRKCFVLISRIQKAFKKEKTIYEVKFWFLKLLEYFFFFTSRNLWKRNLQNFFSLFHIILYWFVKISFVLFFHLKIFFFFISQRCYWWNYLTKQIFQFYFFLIQKRKEKSLNSGLAVIDNFSREFLQGDANFYVSKM